MLQSRFGLSMVRMCVLILVAGMAYGQEFPSKPVRLVVAAPGGGSDFTARILAQGLTPNLGQQVIVDYRGGGIQSIEYVQKSPPDGYTLHITGSTMWVLPLVNKVPYDAEKDFMPITLIDMSPSVMAVHPSVPVKSVEELIALAKARPGELNFSSSPAGGSGHLAGELLKHMAGVNIIWVPYKSAGLAITALIAGEVHLTTNDASLMMPHVKAGRVRALGVTTAQPSPLAPGLPTIMSTGLPGYEAAGRTGIWAPAKTPDAVIRKLNQELVRVLNQPDVKEKFLSAGSETVGSTPEQFAALIRSEIVKVGKLVKDAGIRAN